MVESMAETSVRLMAEALAVNLDGTMVELMAECLAVWMAFYKVVKKAD